MGYFPLCVDLRGKTVLLVGHGPQTDEKFRRLQSFGADIRRLDGLTAADLTEEVAFVAAGDLDEKIQAEIYSLCRAHRVPVNVVDCPEKCSFFFPALITRGDLTISVSTGGTNPGAAGILRGRIEESLPDEMEGILQWLSALRRRLYEAYPKKQARQILGSAGERAFALGRPLGDEELGEMMQL